MSRQPFSGSAAAIGTAAAGGGGGAVGGGGAAAAGGAAGSGTAVMHPSAGGGGGGGGGGGFQRFTIQEVLPKAGLVYSEKGNLSEVLCKPKIMPLKSVTLEKLEAMEREAAAALSASAK